MFSILEKQLLQEEIDSVLVLCDDILDKESNTRARGIAYFYKGQAASLYNDKQDAVYYQRAIGFFKTANFGKGLAMVYSKKANLYYFQKKYSAADSLYNLSIDYASSINLHEVLADVYQKKSLIYTYYQDQDSAIDFLKTALRYAVLKNNKNQIKNLLNEVSTNYQSVGQLDSAIYYFQKSLHLKQDMGDNEGLISDYSALGNLYKERGDYIKAQENLTNALKIAEIEQDSFSIMTIYLEKGDIYISQEKWSIAEVYYKKSLALAHLKNSLFTEAESFKKLGHVYQFQNKDTAALENLEAALKIYRQLNNKTNTANVLISLSQMYKNDDQFIKAKTLLLEALNARSYSLDVLSILSIKMSLAKIETEHGNPKKGIEYAEECLQAFEEMENKKSLSHVYLLLADAYVQTSDFEKAFQFHLDFTKLKDSLTSIDRAKVIQKYDLLYLTEKYDKETAQNRVESKVQEATIQQNNHQLLLLKGGLIFTGAAVLLLIFIYHKNKQLNKQKIKILEKEKETQNLKSVIEGEEKERKRIATELHDGLGAVLATVKMQISSIRYKLPAAKVLPTYQKAEELIDDACRTVREIAHNLMPHVLEQEGLEFAINDLCQIFSSHNDIEFEFNYFGKEQELSDVIKTTIFRITQELLKNIIKHAEAKEVIVQLTIEDDEIILIIEDNGKGFDVSAQYKGIGLESIRSRTAYLNGTLDIDSATGQGSTFTIFFPLNQK